MISVELFVDVLVEVDEAALDFDESVVVVFTALLAVDDAMDECVISKLVVIFFSYTITLTPEEAPLFSERSFSNERSAKEVDLPEFSGDEKL